MSREFLGQRRKGLEEAYFAKHNRELMARLRKESARPQDAAPSAEVDLPTDEATGALAGRAQPVLSVRALRPEDSGRYGAFLERIDAGDLRFRFGRSFEGSTAAALARLTRVDHEREAVFVAIADLQAGVSEIVGEVRARADEYGRLAEFAILVRSDFQRLGIGRLLLEQLIAHTRIRGVRLLYGLVTSSNTGMLALAHRLGFDIDHVPGSTTVVVSLDLKTGTSGKTRRERAGNTLSRRPSTA